MDFNFARTPISRRGFLQRLLTVAAAISLPCFLNAASPATRTYRVVKGDTLGGIAKRFGVSLAALQQANGLKSTDIMAGQTLRIPGAATTVAAAKPAPQPAKPSAKAARHIPSASPIAGVVAANKSISVQRYRWKYIVVHHSAIERGNAASYGAAHRQRGMVNGLAYHFVIGNGVDSGDGQIEIGPRWKHQLKGGHVHSDAVNEVGIGICLVGNLENHPPTPRQWNSLVQLVNYLRANCAAPGCKITVHKWVDRNRTVCPGKRFPYAEFSRQFGVSGPYKSATPRSLKK